MHFFTIAPPLAYLAAVFAILFMVTRPKLMAGKGMMIALVIGIAFLLISALTLFQDGLIGFWQNHTANLSGNQVWFDLLLAVSISFYLILPRARAAGMNVKVWALAVILSASIALLFMLARLLWLENQKTA